MAEQPIRPGPGGQLQPGVQPPVDVGEFGPDFDHIGDPDAASPGRTGPSSSSTAGSGSEGGGVEEYRLPPRDLAAAGLTEKFSAEARTALPEQGPIGQAPTARGVASVPEAADRRGKPTDKLVGFLGGTVSAASAAMARAKRLAHRVRNANHRRSQSAPSIRRRAATPQSQPSHRARNPASAPNPTGPQLSRRERWRQRLEGNDSYDSHRARASSVERMAGWRGIDLNVDLSDRQVRKRLREEGLSRKDIKEVRAYQELADDAKAGFLNAIIESGVIGTVKTTVGMALLPVLLSWRGVQRLRGVKPNNNGTGGKPSMLQLAAQGIGAAGAGIGVRFGLNTLLPVLGEAVSAIAGASVALLMATVKGEVWRQKNDQGKYTETPDYHRGRVLSIVGRGAAMGIFGHLVVAPHMAGATHSAVSAVGRGVSNFENFVHSVTGNTGSNGASGGKVDLASPGNVGSRSGHITVPPRDGPGPGAGSGTGGGGTPAYPELGKPIIVPPEAQPQPGPSYGDLKTDQLGAWNGKLDPVAHYTGATPESAIMKALMTQYAAAHPGEQLNVAELQKMDGFSQLYENPDHGFVAQVLKDNGFTWKDGNSLDDNQALIIKADTLQRFADQLHGIGGDKYPPDAFKLPEPTAPDMSGPVGSDAIFHPGVADEAPSGLEQDVLPRGGGGGLAGAQAILDGFNTFIAQGNVGGPAESVQRFWEANPAAYASFNGLGDDARRALTGMIDYAATMGGGVEMTLSDIGGIGAVVSDFVAKIAENPPAPSITPGAYIDEYLRGLEASGNQVWQAYASMHEAAQYALVQRLLEELAENQKELANAQ